MTLNYVILFLYKIKQKETYPYGYLSFALHFVITDAAKPANKAVQSKNMWKESDMSPKL